MIFSDAINLAQLWSGTSNTLKKILMPEFILKSNTIHIPGMNKTFDKTVHIHISDKNQEQLDLSHRIFLNL